MKYRYKKFNLNKCLEIIYYNLMFLNLTYVEFNILKPFLKFTDSSLPLFPFVKRDKNVI